MAIWVHKSNLNHRHTTLEAQRDSNRKLWRGELREFRRVEAIPFLTSKWESKSEDTSVHEFTRCKGNSLARWLDGFGGVLPHSRILSLRKLPNQTEVQTTVNGRESNGIANRLKLFKTHERADAKVRRRGHSEEREAPGGYRMTGSEENTGKIEDGHPKPECSSKHERGERAHAAESCRESRGNETGGGPEMSGDRPGARVNTGDGGARRTWCAHCASEKMGACGNCDGYRCTNKYVEILQTSTSSERNCSKKRRAQLSGKFAPQAAAGTVGHSASYSHHAQVPLRGSIWRPRSRVICSVGGERAQGAAGERLNRGF
ncbi:hypothetical protein C8R45DRAFT_935813 [Mycena sanguinolenta]|nr:hypothetical protein C8R45DRAFT_935813 [Mycena sanguinolenta]